MLGSGKLRLPPELSKVTWKHYFENEALEPGLSVLGTGPAPGTCHNSGYQTWGLKGFSLALGSPEIEGDANFPSRHCQITPTQHNMGGVRHPLPTKTML